MQQRHFPVPVSGTSLQRLGQLPRRQHILRGIVKGNTGGPPPVIHDGKVVIVRHKVGMAPFDKILRVAPASHSFSGLLLAGH